MIQLFWIVLNLIFIKIERITMLDSVTTVASNAGPIKTPTHRKINKLMMEKRRRTRINNCLSELKTLVLKALKKDGEQFSKLEKVDILEMTVKYLRFLHQQQQVNITTDSLGGKYRVPLDVSAEVMRYMNSEEARSRLTDHISKCVRVSNGSPTQHIIPTSTQTPTPTAAHQQINTPQTSEQHIRQSQPQTAPLGDNTTHIVLPIASKQSENSLMMAAVPETPYKTLTVSYTAINSPVSSSPSTHVINTPVNSLTAITSPNTITSPSIVHMKALVSDSNASNGCYVSTVPVYVGSISEAKPTSATLAGFYTQPLKRNCSPEPIKELPLWRPW
nr:hairy and enhancer of split 1 [Doryteuthis pealeii]